MFILEVSEIGCGGCVSKGTRLDNEATVSVDRTTGKVNVESNGSPERVRTLVDALGFPSK